MNTNEEFINEERINLPNGKSVAQYKLSRMNYLYFDVKSKLLLN